MVNDIEEYLIKEVTKYIIFIDIVNKMFVQSKNSIY